MFGMILVLSWRRFVRSYDSKGNCVEVVVFRNKVAYHDYVGMRTPSDVSNVLQLLQGETVQRELNGKVKIMTSLKLFLDYADITQRPMSKEKRRTEGIYDETDKDRGLPFTRLKG